MPVKLRMRKRIKPTAAHLGPHRFQKGNIANPAGRPKGSRNKLGEAFLLALKEDFEEHGKRVIERVRRIDPTAYMKVVASLLPKEFDLNVNNENPYKDIPTPELLTKLRELDERFRDVLVFDRIPGPPEGVDKTHLN